MSQAAPKQSKIKQVFVQTPVTIPGICTTHSDFSNVKLPGYEYSITQNGVEISKSGKAIALIPSPNVKVIIFE